MSSAPRLTRAQMRLIESDLPPARRDPKVIAAIFYRASSGQSLREVSEIDGVSRARLHEWEAATASSLPDVLRKLRLSPAPVSMSRRGGTGWRRKPDTYQRVQALRLEHFGAALRRSGA